MYQLGLLGEAFVSIFSQMDAFLGVVLGSIIGLFLGATPGLTAVVGMVLLIPFTFYMSPLAGISMLYAIHKSGNYGGSIPAILMNTPGSPAAACTQMDGYPLTQQGKQGKALKVAVTASALGDLLSDFVLIFGTVYIAHVVYAFGPVEMAGVLFFSLTLIGTITGASMLKGLFSTALGLLIGTIGLDPMQATPRFSFGLMELEKSLDVIPVLVGVFVVSEVLIQAEKRLTGQDASCIAPQSGNPADSRLSAKEFKSILPATGISYLVGQVVGILPGLGGAVAPWIAYGQVKNFSKEPEKFGEGALEGVAAAEASNNAVCGANLMPMLTLGVPGSTDAAIIMGAFLIHGLELGPRIFNEQAPLVYGLFAAGLMAIAIYFVIGFFLAEKIGCIITAFPRRIIYPIIMITCFIGAYAPNTSLFDVGLMIIFGLVGYLMRKFKVPVAPMIIAFLLAYKFETALRQALVMGNGPMVFLQHPICVAFIIMALGTIAFTAYRNSVNKKKQQAARKAQPGKA
jgi:putative tricarboxylic transport membrane protein